MKEFKVTENAQLLRKKDIKAIIFDFDDTLVDENFWIENRWKKTVHFAEDELRLKNFGKDFWKIFEEKGPKYKYHVNDTLTQLSQSQVLVKPIVNNFLSQISEERLYDGVIECLNFLKDKFKLGIITNGREEIQINRIKKVKLYHFFDTIICAYRKPKPSFEPYIECLHKLGVSGKEAMYIGHDPKIDFEGAKKLQMTTACFNPKNAAKPKEADMQIRSYSDLIKFIKD